MGAIAKTDIELVEASLRGEHDAFGHLVARYQDVVCAVSYSSTGDQVLGEDVAQDTFIAAWRQLDRLRNSARLRPWLCGIARNLARTARKRRRREELVELDEHIAAGATPFDTAARGDVERIVRDALAGIPDTYREVLVLYYREDQSIREVAETLGLTETTVMQRLSRGRRYLADGLTDLVERSLRSDRRERDLVASVLAAIAAIAIPSRVDASPTTKGSTMLKFAIAASALVAAGTTAYLLHGRKGQPSPAPAAALHYGSGRLGLAHPPSLGPTAASRALVSRSIAEADLALLPADSEAVIGVNVAQMRKSAVWQRYIAPKLPAVAEIRAFEAMCGFDPIASLGSIAIGAKGLGESNKMSAVVVIHGFDKARAMSCFDTQAVPRAESAGVKITIDGEVALLTTNEGGLIGEVALTFIDNATALIVIGREAATKDSVLRIARGNSGLETSQTFATALQWINTDDSLWLMVADGSPMLRSLNADAAPFIPVPLGTLYVSLNVANTLALDVGVHLSSPAAVAKLVAAMQGWLANEMVKQLVDNVDQLDLVPDGSDLIVSMAMSGAQVGQLVGNVTVDNELDVRM